MQNYTSFLQTYRPYLAIDSCFLLFFDHKKKTCRLNGTIHNREQDEIIAIEGEKDLINFLLNCSDTFLSVNPASDERLKGVSLRLGAHSLDPGCLLALPLKREANRYGFLILITGDPAGFSDHQTSIALTIAEYITSELFNLDLIGQIERRHRELSKLYHISNQLIRSMDTGNILQTVIDAAVDTVPEAEKGSLLLYNPTMDCLEVIAQHGYDQKDLTGFRLPVGQGYSGAAFLERKNLIINDMQGTEGSKYHVPVENGFNEPIRSAITVVLQYQDRCIGTISMENFHRKNAFTDEDMNILSSYASLAAIIIEHHRLFHDVKKRSNEMEYLNQYSSRIINLRKLNELFEVTLHAVRKALPQIHRCYIVYRMEHQSYELVARDGYDLNTSILLSNIYHLGYGGEAINTGTNIIYTSTDTEKQTEYQSYFDQLNMPVASAMVTLIRNDEEIMGALVAENPEYPHAFQEADLALFNSFAAQAALAVGNIDFYANLEKKVRERTQKLMEMNQKILEADRLKSQFIANISHELRTPLNAVIGFSELLLDNVLGEVNPDQRECLDDIHTSGKHLLNIINDILDLSKIQAGKMELFIEDFILQDAVRSVERNLLPHLQSKEQTLVVHIPPDFPPIRGDIKKIKQVLNNLINNAIKYSSIGKTIDLYAEIVQEERGRMLEVRVVDYGKGISPEHIKIIFDEFRQVDGSHTREDSGTGLGLALCKHMVEIHGGHISVTSEVGKGSQFTFRIPQDGYNLNENAEEGDLAVRTHSHRRVLVVEDDALSASLLKRFLETEGYEVYVTQLGEEAISEAKRLNPLVITLDIMLPGMNGWQVLQQLKSDPDTSQIPVVIVSATEDPQKAYHLHAHDYFVKPLEKDQLLARIRQLTELSQLKTSIRNVLIVDDDKGFLLVTGTLLEREGLKVHKASNGPEAIEMLKTIKPDVVLLDLLMPGMSGLEVLEEIKKNPDTKDLPIIILTAADVSRQQNQALKGKIRGLIEKTSYHPDDLANEIRRIIS